MSSPEPANRGNSPIRLATTTSLARENQISVGTLKEQWPQDVAAVICIGRRTLLRYRITNRTDDGTPCPGLFEIVRIRTDSRSDEYGLTTRQQLQEERDARRIQRDEMEASAKKNTNSNEENSNEEADNNNNNDSILSDNSHDYEESAAGAPQLLQTEIVAAVSSASLNPINPLPVFGSLHHFRVPLPSALSATDNFYENDDGDHDNDEHENKKSAVEGEQDDEPAALSEVAAAGGIDGVNHTIMDLMSTMLKERKAFKKEPRDLTDTIKNPKFSTRDRIFAIALDGRSFAILSVAAPPLRPRKAQPIRVQFMGDGSLNKTAAAAAEEENRRRRELEERLRQERERKEREMNQDPPLFLRRTGSFPFEVTAAAMFILSYTDMVGLSDAYKKVGSEAAPVVGPLPFPPDASMSRCMKELSRMSTMCLRQKHCCFCYSAASGNFVILEMSSLSSDDVSVAGQAVVASGNIGPGWTSVVWAGPLCRSSDFVRSGTHRPYTTYRVRFFCYNAESGFSTMETITIPCETLAPKGTSRNNNNNNNTAAGSGPNGSLVSESSASVLFQQQQQKLRSRRRSTVTKLAPVESEGEIRTSSLIASPFSISGQRMCIMIAVANDSAILPLDDFDEQRATMMSCSSASSTSRLTASMTTPWTRFYSVASRISHEAWQKIESSLEDSQRTATPAFQGGNSSTTANNSIRNDKSFNASYSSEGSVLRPPSPAALRKRRPTAVVAQAIMQEKVFSIPELEWSRFVTIHERYTDGGNYDEVLSYSASRGTAWISRIVYDDRWHKKALEDRLNADLLADEAEDAHIRDEVEKLLATSTKIKDSNNTMIRRKSSTKNGLDGEDGGYGGSASAFSPNSNNVNDRKKSGKIARIRENNGEIDAAKRKSSQTMLSDSGPEIDHRENDEDDVANDSNRGSRSRRRRRGGSNSNNNSQRRTSAKSQNPTMTPAERRAKGLQAVPPPGKSLRNRNNRNSASIEEYDENQDRRQESPNSRRNADSSGRDYKKMPSWGRAPFSNNNNSARSNSNNNNSSRRFDNDNNTGQDDDEEREGSQVHRPGTSAHHGKNSNNRTSSPHNNNNNYSDRPPSGKWVKPRPPSSSFAPLLFPKNGQPDQYGNYYANNNNNNNMNNNRPGTGNSQFGRRPWSGSGHAHANNHSSQQQLPSLADDDAPEDYHYPGDIGSFGSRPPSSSRRAAVRSAAKAMAERVANNQESTPQELSKQRRSEAIVQSMSEMQKLGIGEEEGAEITDIEKIIKYMKKNDPKAQKANKQKKKEGEEVKKEGDKTEDEDDDEDDDDEEQEAEGNEGDGDDDAEAKKKKAAAPSISALRKSRSSVDRRIYKRAQELLAGSEITPEWFDAALLHLNRASGAADDARRTNIVFALSEEPMPTMQFQVGEREGKFIRRAKHSTSWSYVLNTRGDLPPKTSRQLRAERKHLQKAKDNEGNAVVDEAYVERFFKNIHPRETYVKAEFAKIEKERAKAMLGKNKETGEPLQWTEETLERLAVNHVKQLADRRAKAEKELDKEAAALQKTKTIPAQTYAEMMTRLGEDERKKNMLAKLQRENDKELSKLFLPAIHHPARNGNEGEKEIFSENPGVLSPEKVKEMANRLSTDFMTKKKEHVAALEQSLEEDRYRFIDEKTKAMYEAQKRPLSAEAEKELGERLAIPVIRSPAPR